MGEPAMHGEKRCNHHCTVLQIDGKGILIDGPPGSGKTSLALGLLEHAERRRLNGAMICDDQAILFATEGRLVATAPPAIAGKVEIRGFGIAGIHHRPACEIALLVRIVADEFVERMPYDTTERLLDVMLPHLKVPARHENQGVRIIAAWLGRGRIGQPES
jgi:serine kinase of HPr protein (carbohydrate metabolism regulator)